MKKCPKCGNPSYDGAPICGNCGYEFPKPKVVVRNEKSSIFGQNQNNKRKKKKTSNEDSVLDIIKEKKLIIGTILLITLIVICGIFITGSHNNKAPAIQTGDLNQYDDGGFSFKFPTGWEEVNLTDEDLENYIFYEDENNNIIEFYNTTTESGSLKEINQNRIAQALENGDAIELLETITVDGRNASNIILENAGGDYTRYVSMFNDGELFVFKITGDSVNSITSDSINDVINSAQIK